MRIRPVAVAFVALASLARGEELRLRDIFDRTAAAPPVRYVLGRDVLFAVGDRAVRLATRYLDDSDPGKRALARLIRLRHERPEQVAAWSDALLTPWIQVTRRKSTPPCSVVRFRRLGSKGQYLEWREVLFGPGSEPILIDALRAGGGPPAPNAAAIAGAMRAGDVTPFLVRLLAAQWNARESAPFENALVAIGPAVAPAVRPLLGGESPAAVAAAARVLGRLADRGSANALLKIVAGSDEDQAFTAAAEALRAIAPERGAAALLDRLLDASSVRVRRSSDGLLYAEIRFGLTPYGEVLRAALERRREGADPVAAAILDGISWEVADPERASSAYAAIGARDGDPLYMYRGATPEESGRAAFWMQGAEGPAALVAERAAAWGAQEDLLRLLDADRARGVKIARVALLGCLRRNGGEDVFLALATRSPAPALDIAEAVLVGDPPHAVERYVEALLLLLDEPRTRPLLEAVAARAKTPRYAKAAPVARAALAVARKERSLADLLAHERDGVALAAARALARRGDPAGVPILAAAAANARDFAYLSLRDDLVLAGAPPEPSPDDDVFRRVLRAAVAFRIAAPERARKIDEAVERARPRVLHIRGVQPGHLAVAGHVLAGALGAGARPLLEEAALFPGERVAIHALGRLADEASIPVLLRVARASPGPAAAALRAMGEKGVEAARAIPPPDPERADFRGRAWRHAAATESLVGEEGGIEKVLEGLAEAPPEGRRDGWAHRMAGYLSAAQRAASGNALDPRLLEPALRLLKQHGDAHTRLREACLDLLAHFRDERVARAALPWLPSDRFARAGKAYRALTQALGDGAIAFVTVRIREAQRSGRPHARLLHTLWRLVQAPEATRADRDACAALLRDACAVGDGRAANDLLLLHIARPAEERDDRDLSAVLRYVALHDKPGVVVWALAEANLPGTGEALLASYRRGNDHRVLAALGRIRYEQAAHDVLRAARRWIEGKRRSPWHAELNALARLGATGLRMTRAFLDPSHDTATRVAAVQALARVRDADAFDGIVALLDQLEPAAAGGAARNQLSSVVWAATEAAPGRAYTEFVRRALAAPEPLRDLYADAASTLRARHPKLAGKLPQVRDD